MSSSNPSLFLYNWIMAPMGTSSSYAHLKFQAPIPSLITLGFWLQWAPSNFFKLYTLEAFSLRHNETLSRFQNLSNTTQALMNTKVHSKICKCNECTHKLSLKTNTQEKRWLRASLFMTLFTSRCEVTVHIYDIVHVYGTVHVYDTVHIYSTIHTTSFFL